MDSFTPVLEEYRDNHNGKGSAAGKARADLAHELLNKFYDGEVEGEYAVNDTGKAMGDLLLQKTSRELGDSYDTMSKNDMIKNVRNIRKAFDRELETNDGKLDRQTVNDLSDMLIDTITVFPKEGSTMRIEVRLKLGMTEEREYAGVMPRSGIIMNIIKHKKERLFETVPFFLKNPLCNG